MTLVLDRNEALHELENMDLNEKIRFKTRKRDLSIEVKNMIELNGDIKPKFSNVSDGSIITLFDKTPFPEKDNDVICPHFVELKWANGCNFDCAWCYLNGTLRFRPMKKKPYLKDKCKIIKHLESYFHQLDIPTLLNSGELSDSLVFEGTNNAITEFIIPLFKKQDKHKLLILTKSANVEGLLSSDSQDRVIVSFSANSFDVARRWEKKAPSPKQRIKAAKKLHDAGYTIRIRIDPIVPIENWKQGYKELINFLFDHFTPERITIGSLRGLQSTVNNCGDKSWLTYLDDTSNWGKKIGFEKRLEMYHTIISYLKNQCGFDDIGVCKDTVEMWKKLGLDYKNIRCNCIL